jgi:ABC-type antimicrobial peptide transport system permease subunit
MEAWNKLGITNVDIQFYDKGYTQLKSGLDAMKNVSLILLLSGTAATLLILTFFTYLFITTQKKRTAIERSLGMSKTSCLLSLLSGVVLIALIGCFAGGIVGYGVSGSVQKLVMLTGQVYDTTFSSWVNNADVQLTLNATMSAPDPFIFILVALGTMLVAVVLALLGIWGNLQSEPLTLLSRRKE